MTSSSPPPPIADSLCVDLRVNRSPNPVHAQFEIPAGCTLALIGPNGSGKSTIAHAIAGLLPDAQGTLTFAGRTLDTQPPNTRRIGYLFQDQRLFGHMRVIDNIAFGIRANGHSPTQARTLAEPFLERFEIQSLANRKADQLSGGQAQRVAIARALAMDPHILILDEPLAPIDAKSKNEIRTLIREVLETFPGPCLYITHDPIDALTLGDHIAVMQSGQIVQIGTPQELQHNPGSSYAASFLGINLLEGTLHHTPQGHQIRLDGASSTNPIWITDPGFDAGIRVCAAISPQAMTLSTNRPTGSARNTLACTVDSIHAHQDRVRIRFTTPAIVAEITTDSLNRLDITPGTTIWVSFKATDVRVYPHDSPISPRKTP